MACWLSELERLVEDRAESAVLTQLQTLVPEYRPMGSWREVLHRDSAGIYLSSAG